MTRQASCQAGFTLAETLVALFILAIVSSAGAALLIGATTTSQQIRDQEQITRQLDVAQRLIRQDIMAMDTRAVRSTDGFSGAINLYGEKPRGRSAFSDFRAKRMAEPWLCRTSQRIAVRRLRAARWEPCARSQSAPGCDVRNTGFFPRAFE